MAKHGIEVSYGDCVPFEYEGVKFHHGDVFVIVDKDEQKNRLPNGCCKYAPVINVVVMNRDPYLAGRELTIQPVSWDVISALAPDRLAWISSMVQDVRHGSEPRFRLSNDLRKFVFLKDYSE